jgi:hypothetical protein
MKPEEFTKKKQEIDMYHCSPQSFFVKFDPLLHFNTFTAIDEIFRQL